ncbi:MAG: kinase [Candidatus Thermoplasmatota archaeon]|jgi:D-glycero-alpha-D-manno-heptose-7-phosphate kinase|nr:kinase [Candidatus Thermoplasmatota archaeon]
MIMSRTPLRITFVGGGTDIPSYYREHGPGAVVSASINKYIYVAVNKKFDSKIRVSYSVTEIVDTVDEIKHPTVREALKLLDIDGGVEIVSISDIPSRGTGLGSSSTFLVGLLNALHAYKGEHASSLQLAEEAVKIEREILGEPGGKQDQYMAAYGGIQFMEFHQDERVSLKPVIMNEEMRGKLQSNLLLMYTGRERSSTEIHKVQANSVANKLESYHLMKGMAFEMFDAMCTGDGDEIGNLLHKNWEQKRQLADGITDKNIDSWYEKALSNGATGGKMIGAGGGGFLLLFANPDKQENIIRALPELKQETFNIEYGGSRIIFVGD